MPVDTRIHARFEITDEAAVARLEALQRNGKIPLLSLMDHTPGQVQCREAAVFVLVEQPDGVSSILKPLCPGRRYFPHV
jgi:alpha-D-ribose 1-methylphosphonate 5-triphosphate diphosphatase PhnM